ncbi:MAG: nucleoside triphosphate pyrophosphohydrolase family protein [Nanoarchaeota archaeon]
MITKEQYLEAVNKIAESVYSFHDRFEIPQLNIYGDSDEVILKALSSRLVLQMEELGEFSQAVSKGRWFDAVHEAADVLYVALGTVLSLGESGNAACKFVSEKNYNKTSLNSKIGVSGKVVNSVRS